MTPERLAAIKARAEAIPRAILNLCAHLADPDVDGLCPCGYRGGIYAIDGEHMVCEMGSGNTPGEEGLEPPRLERKLELAYASVFAHAPVDIPDLIADNERLRAELDAWTNYFGCDSPHDTDVLAGTALGKEQARANRLEHELLAAHGLQGSL